MLRAALLALTLFSILPAHADSKHFLWRVSKGGDTLYLAGSVHVLRSSDYPLPQVMEQAFKDSAGLVEEIDLADLDAEGMQMDMLKTGAYQDGRKLQSMLPPELYQKLVQAADADGLDMQLLGGLKPWLASLMLLDAQLVKAGYDPQDGADAHFAAEAKSQHKPVTGLERPQDQIGILARLSERDQVALVQQAVDESSSFETEVQQMITAWHAGDSTALDKDLKDEFGGYPEVYQAMLVTRNRAWIPKLETLLNSGKQYFVIVGALHLVGPDGLLQQFKKDGYTVEQL